MQGARSYLSFCSAQGLTRRAIFYILVALSGVLAMHPHLHAAPDRAQFIRECLDAAPTSETPKFDAYTEGNYHVDKLDLVQGIEEATKSQPGRLRAVVIFGPSGPLWTYHVLVALSEGDSIRINSVVMPHARITGKATKTLTRVELEEILNKLSASEALTEGDLTSIDATEPHSRDFAYDILVSIWTDHQRSLRFAGLGSLMREATPQAKEAEAVIQHLNRLLKDSEQTYPQEDQKDASKEKGKSKPK